MSDCNPTEEKSEKKILGTVTDSKKPSRLVQKTKLFNCYENFVQDHFALFFAYSGFNRKRTNTR